MTGFRIELVDLDPADGITPAVSFAAGSSYGLATATIGWESNDSKSVHVPLPFQAASGDSSKSV